MKPTKVENGLLTENKVWCCPREDKFDCCDDQYEWMCFNQCNPNGGNTIQNGICVGGDPNPEEGTCDGNYTPSGTGPLSADNFEKTTQSNTNPQNPIGNKPGAHQLDRTIKKELSMLKERQIILTEQVVTSEVEYCKCNNYDDATASCNIPPGRWPGPVGPNGGTIANMNLHAVGNPATTMFGANVGDNFCELWASQGGQVNNGGSCGNCVNYSNGIVGCTETYVVMDVVQTNNQIQGQPVYHVTSPPSYLCGGGGSGSDEYHMWTECSNFTGAGGSQSMTWSGLPGYISGADPNNSLIFYDWIDTTIGGISVGDVIKIDLAANNQTYTLCLQYDGVTTNVTPVTPWNSPLTIVSPHPNCDDCINNEMPYCCLLGGTPCFQITSPTECDWGTTYPDLPTCQANCGDPEERGCLDPMALNYNECCPNTPGCIPILPDEECCRFEHEPDQEGCMDSTAINYMTCCDPNIPGCVPTLPNPECCRHEGGDGCDHPLWLALNTTGPGGKDEYCKICSDPTSPYFGNHPLSFTSIQTYSYFAGGVNYCHCCDPIITDDPCKTNPKDCWFCEPGDIDISGWQDPMALVNANGGCIQFSSTNTTYASSYAGQMFTTKIDCENTTECRPSNGEMIECQCCNGGNPQSMSQSVPANPGCSVLEVGGLWNCQPQQSQPISCKKPLPTNDVPIELAEEIKRYKTLL